MSWCSDLFLQQDDPPQQLVLQAPLGDGEVHHSRPGADLGAVRRVGQLGGDVEREALHHIHFLISYLHLQEEEGGTKLYTFRLIYVVHKRKVTNVLLYKLIQT